MLLTLKETFSKYMIWFGFIPSIIVFVLILSFSTTLLRWLNKQNEILFIKAHKVEIVRAFELGNYIYLGKKLQEIAHDLEWSSGYILDSSLNRIASYPNNQYWEKYNKEFDKQHVSFEVKNDNGKKLGTLFFRSGALKLFPYYGGLIFLLVIVMIIMTVAYYNMKNLLEAHGEELSGLSIELINESDHLEELNRHPLSAESSRLIDALRKYTIKQKLWHQTEIIREKSIALHDLASQVSHDIRSPLSVLKLLLEEVNNENSDTVNLALNRLVKIADDLLENNRISKNHPLDLNYLVSECLRIFTPIFKANKVDIQFADTHEKIMISADELILSRIISILLSNAVESLVTDCKKINIMFQFFENEIKFLIVDSGKGISDHHLSFLFQKGITFGKEKGTGLGLFYAKTYLDQIGASISLQSKLGQGTQVTLTFKKIL